MSLTRSGARYARRQSVHYIVGLTGTSVAYRMSTNSGAWGPRSAAKAFTVRLKAGRYRIKVQASSSAGVLGPVVSDTVVVDRTRPVLRWSTKQLRGVTTITVAARDTLSGVNRPTLRWSVKRVMTRVAGKRLMRLVVTPRSPIGPATA